MDDPTPYDILVDHGGREVTEAALRDLTRQGWRLVRVGPCRNPEAGMACGCTDLTILEQYDAAWLTADDI